MRAFLPLALVAVLATGAFSQQLETNDAGGSLFVGTGTNPPTACPTFVTAVSTLNMRVAGAPSVPIILLLGQLATTSIPTDSSNAEYFDLNLSSFIFVLADGFTGGGAIPFFNHTNANGYVDFAFGMNAGVNIPFAFQAVVADAGAPFGLNFTAASAYDFDTTPPIPTLTPTQTLVQADDSGTVRNLAAPILIYGGSFTQVQVDTNGWIKFGNGLTAGSNFTNSLALFLGGNPVGTAGPLVAPMWDDLDVGNRLGTQGLLIDDAGPGHLICTWLDPDRFPAERLGGSVTCDINDNGGTGTIVTVTYALGSSNPAIVCAGGPFFANLGPTVGVSRGPGVSTQTAVDLATGGVVNPVGNVGGPHTIYQDFANGTFDLDGVALTFVDAAGTTGDFLLF